MTKLNVLAYGNHGLIAKTTVDSDTHADDTAIYMMRTNERIIRVDVRNIITSTHLRTFTHVDGVMNVR